MVAEVGYLLEAKVGTVAEAAFLDAPADGDLELVDLIPEDLARMAELVRRYDDLPLGTTDASAIALAERLGDGRAGRAGRANRLPGTSPAVRILE